MAETAGVMLLRAGLISQEQLSQALASRRAQGGTVGAQVIRQGALTEEQLADFFRHRLMVPKVGKEALGAVAKKVIALVPSDMAAEFFVVPVSLDREGNLTLAMADPSDTHAVDEVGFFTGHFVMRAVATESAITWALEKYYGVVRASPAAPASPAAAAPEAPPVVELETDQPSAAEQAEVRQPPPAIAPQPIPQSGADEVALPPHPAPATAVTATPVDVPPVVLERTPAAAVAAEPALAAAPAAADDAGDAGITLVDFQYTRSGRVAAATTADAPAASAAASSLAEAINALRTAEDADTVACALLIYVSSFCERAIFFNVRKGALRSHDCTGKDIDLAPLKELSISGDEPSVFRDVMAGRFPYRGAPGDSAAVQALAAVMPPPVGDVVLLPIAVRHRVVSVVYGDRLTAELTEAGMTRVALEAGIAYERVIAARKESGTKPV